MTFCSGINYYTDIGEYVQDHYTAPHGKEGAL